MKFPPAVFLFLLLLTSADAQITLLRAAPNDSFDLACARCFTEVSYVAITKGHYTLSLNPQKPAVVNLLLWRYFDKIMGKDMLAAEEQLWTTSTQLLDEIAPDELLTLHINLNWGDSTARFNKLYLIVAGLTKKRLSELPMECIFDPDAQSIMRFSAVAQIASASSELQPETYDCIDGTFILDRFDPKTGALSGKFEFVANRIGVIKRGFFVNGVFQRG